MREGYRLCLVYNLTLTKGKKAIFPSRPSEYVQSVSRLLAEWANQEDADKLAITLDHQYTQEGLAWDALKGVDVARADVLREAAALAGCRIHLALLTFHETGQGEVISGDRYYGRRRHEDEDEERGEYEMVEVFDSDLSADHWRDSQDKRLELGALSILEEDLLEPEALKRGHPTEAFKGYTGNEGMTLNRWYRHGAIFLWPERKHFEIFCNIGGGNRVAVLKRMVNGWREAAPADEVARKATCLQYARSTVANWSRGYGWPEAYGQERTCELLPLLEQLEDVDLIRAYLSDVLPKDSSVEPGNGLVTICNRYGWATFRKELEAVFRDTSADTLDRNLRLLERLSTVKATKKAGRAERLGELAAA